MNPEICNKPELIRRITKDECSLQMTYTGQQSDFMQKLDRNVFVQDKIDKWTVARINSELAGIFGHFDVPLQTDKRWIAIYSSADEHHILVCAIDQPRDRCAVWTFFCTQALQRQYNLKLARRCFEQLAHVAVQRSELQDVSLVLSPQNGQSFSWRSMSVHPLQASENFYQRKVAAKEIDDPANARDQQTSILREAFVLGGAKAEPLKAAPLLAVESLPLASVRMNHLIDSFYLFRLLIAYRVSTSGALTEDIRMRLSSELTSAMHDRGGMAWLGLWLAKKIAEIGRRVERLNTEEGRRSVIFFLKGGRALNYWLGTPEQGENDWDTQVVIDPFLPQDRWYALFAKVHDLLLTTLSEFQAEFTHLLADHAPDFAAHLRELADGRTDTDGMPFADDAMDIANEQANCKAELIDIGIPRRDQPAALEEWHRLSANGALSTGVDGVIFPTRTYYVNEYLMMVREAFRPGGNIAKMPKRVKRFVEIFRRGGKVIPDARQQQRMACLPKSQEKLQAFDQSRADEAELLQIIGAQFVQAYSLRLDREICERFDDQLAKMIEFLPELPLSMDGSELEPSQKKVAQTVLVAEHLSQWLEPVVRARSTWLESHTSRFVGTLQQLHTLLQPVLSAVGAQMAVSGSFAGLLHSRQLRMARPGQPMAGLEPTWRILVKLQYPPMVNPQDLWEAVLPIIKVYAETIKSWAAMEISPHVERDSQVKLDSGAFSFYHAVGRDNPLGYAPLFLKVRMARQEAQVLPPVSAVSGLPLVDLRYQIADCARRAAKIDELGVRQMLNMARRASINMATHLEVVSDE